MNKIPIIQYLPLTRPKATKLFTRRLNNSNIMAILDLEDSAQNPFSLEKTDQLKIQARNGLDSISKDLSFKPKCKTYLRINGLNTKYFEDDIKAAISAFKNNIAISGIFVPKVEDYFSIQEINNRFSHLDFNLEIIPMIETMEGINNLPSILESDKKKNIFSRIHYGHFDYCFDAKVWPFTDPYHKEFWEVIKNVAELVEKHKKTYIHTPFPFPENENLFWASSFYLKELFPALDIWICTLNSELSLSSQPDIAPSLLFNDYDTSHTNQLKEAKVICKDFLSGKANKRSFSVSNGRFIPPHQYYAAQNYLMNLKLK